MSQEEGRWRDRLAEGATEDTGDEAIVSAASESSEVVEVTQVDMCDGVRMEVSCCACCMEGWCSGTLARWRR